MLKRALPCLLLLLAACAEPIRPAAVPSPAAAAAPPPAASDLLAAVSFHQGHNVGMKSPPSGLLRLAAGSRDFQPLAWPEVIASSVAIDKSGRWLYLACGNGVLVSQDAGQSWVLTGGIELAEVQRVCIDARDPRRAFAASAFGLFRCDDVLAEQAWTRLEHDASFLYCSDVRQDAAAPETLWIASERGLFVSQDGGQSVERRGPETSVRRVLQDAHTPRSMWATSDGLGLLASFDGGKSFAPLSGSPPSCFCVERPQGLRGTLLAGGAGAVHRSDDFGWSWSALGEGLPGDFVVLSVAADPADHEHLCASGCDGVFESRDGGQRWRRLGLPGALTPEVRFARLAQAPRQGPPEAPGSLELAHGEEREAHRPQKDAEFEKRRVELLKLCHAQLKARAPGERDLFQAILAAWAAQPGPKSPAWLDALLAAPSHAMFFSLPAIGLYLHARDRLAPETAERLRVLLTEHPIYRGDTENHWVMHYTALLLAAQTWPETPAARWYMGRSSASLYAEARAWLVHWARLAATQGQGEFDSPTYMFTFVTPMLLLHDFAAEAELRQLAGMMLDLLLADYLSESLAGAYCGGHSRAPHQNALETRDNQAAVYHYLYAGGTEPPAEPHGWIIPALLSSYAPPVEFAGIANQRSACFVHTEVKRVRNVIRFGAELNPPVYKTDYMTPRFCLGSLQGGILQPIQQHTWDVTWLGSAANATLFSVHPSVSRIELGMFFPEEPRCLTRSVAAQKSTYASPDKWISASPWERVFQHENVLLALYGVPPSWTYPHVDVHWPRCLARTEAGGWWFGQDGDFFLACRATRPGTWRDEGAHERLRLDGGGTGIVVITPPPEMAAAGEKALRDFQRMVLQCAPPVLGGEGLGLTLRFDLPDGRQLECSLGEELGRLNGAPAPFAADRLFHGPFLESKKGTGVIELTDGKTTRVLDFNDFTIRTGKKP
ncbi:MAG: hypothetical protein HY812_11200 [Planctomycetes bacterium]|nr:hypothetical protein [Planctomycetota bacterium]